MDLSLGLPGSKSLAAAGWPGRNGKKGGKTGGKGGGGNRFAAFADAAEAPAAAGGGGGSRGSKARQRKEAEKKRRLEELRRLDPKAAEELERRRAERKQGKGKGKGKGKGGKSGPDAADRGGFPAEVYTPSELAQIDEPTADWLQQPSSNKRVLAAWIIAHASAADKERWEVVGSNHKQKAFKRTKLAELRSMVSEAWANRCDETAKWARRLGAAGAEGPAEAAGEAAAAAEAERATAAKEAEAKRQAEAKAAAVETAASLRRVAAALAEGSVSKATEALSAATAAAQEKRRAEEAKRAAEAAAAAKAAARAALPQSADEVPFSHVSGFRIPAALPVSAAKKAGREGVTLPECLLRFAAIEHLKVADGNGYCCDVCSYEPAPVAQPAGGVAAAAAAVAALGESDDDLDGTAAAASAGASGDAAGSGEDAVEPNGGVEEEEEEEEGEEEDLASEAESEPDVRARSLRDATRRLLLLDCPEVLTVHLKRFVPTMRGTFAKNSAHVQFSSKLRLRAVVAQRVPAEGGAAEELVEEDVRYECIGVVVHHGSTIGGGHYTAFAKSVNGWHHISDSSSSPAQWSQVKSSQAYMVFYQRVRPAPAGDPAALGPGPAE